MAGQLLQGWQQGLSSLREPVDPLARLGLTGPDCTPTAE